MRKLVWSVAVLLVMVGGAAAQEPAPPPIYLWFEPEWFAGVEGSFAYWTGTAKPTGTWGVAGPGISAEWSQGGESEWNSMGAPAEETKAQCQRDFVVPRAGKYTIWVRYVDHRHKNEPFRVRIEQGGKTVLSGELGSQPVVPANDEYQLFWGFSFGWGSLTGQLDKGPARLVLAIDRAGEGWRQLDAVLITDDAQYQPVGREKPAFAYEAAFRLQPKEKAVWRGSARQLSLGAIWKRPPLGGRDFSMWTGIETDPKWWGSQKLDALSLYDVYFQFSPPSDIRDKFHKQFAGQKNIPILSWPGLLPGFYLGTSPDLSPAAPGRKWLERTKTPFYILTNYANPQYDDKTGPATYAALTGPLSQQFLGFIHGESMGTSGVVLPQQPLGPTRRQHVDALGQSLRQQQAAAWSKIFKTPVPEDFISRSISCLSVDSISLAHLFHHLGCQTVGYELDSTNVHAPMRIAFERGAARQYGHRWINYASGNFGDACNYFTQNPVVPRGAPAWFHSKYAITDGVSAAWYRKLYYLNYLSGASAIYWEQSLANQWMLPGPGTHPIQLSPFGRGTVDFQEFVSRLPERGEPYTPIAFLLSYGHASDRVNYACKMLHVFREDKNDLELRELFDVCWHPTIRTEGQPAAPDVQSMPGGIYGNIFDVLVDRPDRASAVLSYPVVWAAGDVDLKGVWSATLKDYVQRGGTLVLNIQAAAALPAELTGLRATGKTALSEVWSRDGKEALRCTPFEVAAVELAGARPLAWAKVPGQAQDVPLITRQTVGEGAVLVTLVPHLLGQDERAHPSVPYLLNGLTQELLPVQVRLSNGDRLSGEIMYQLNKTKDGYVIMLMNTRGIDKTQNGIARVDRRAFVDVKLHLSLPIRSAQEVTQPRPLTVAQTPAGAEIALRVHPGDVQVIALTAGGNH